MYPQFFLQGIKERNHMAKNKFLDNLKVNIIPEIYAAALEYKNNMVGKTFLYVFDNRFIEVIFKTDNFKHLTGIASTLTPNEFYNEAISGFFEKEQINFTSRHPYDLAKKKLKHLKNIYIMSSSECFIQEDITTNTATYKFATTNLDFSLLLTEDIDSFGILRSEKYITKSLRDKDSFDKSRIVYEVTHIFIKNNNVKKYSIVTYNSNNKLPKELEDKIDDSIKGQFVFK